MTKHVTAIYRTHAVAADVKQKIEALGIGGHDVSIIPDDPTRPADGTHRTDDQVSDIDHLNLPDDDARTFKRAVRAGDYVVSAKVDDDDHIAKVEDAMRHPEHVYDIDAYDRDYRATPDYATDMEREKAMAARDAGLLYRRDTARTTSHARTYSR